MNDPAMPPPESPPHVGHETTDASPLYVGLFALGLTLMVALVLPLLGWIFWRFEAAARRADAPQSALPGNRAPPQPVLQSDPSAELIVFRREEQQRLTGYGWIDRNKRVVHVPIERAIEILSERGLPEPPAKGGLAP